MLSTVSYSIVLTPDLVCKFGPWRIWFQVKPLGSLWLVELLMSSMASYSIVLSPDLVLKFGPGYGQAFRNSMACGGNAINGKLLEY